MKQIIINCKSKSLQPVYDEIKAQFNNLKLPYTGVECSCKIANQQKIYKCDRTNLSASFKSLKSDVYKYCNGVNQITIIVSCYQVKLHPSKKRPRYYKKYKSLRPKKK